MEPHIHLIKQFFAAETVIVFGYLFGSTAEGRSGPLSDLDLAVWLDESVEPFRSRLLLMEALAKQLKTENFDMIVLNSAPVLLQYEVIRKGMVLKDEPDLRVPFEARVLSTYLDTAHLRRVQRGYLKERLQRSIHGKG